MSNNRQYRRGSSSKEDGSSRFSLNEKEYVNRNETPKSAGNLSQKDQTMDTSFTSLIQYWMIEFN